MAESRNIFVKSKMNKDLDERLLPQGEYRDGQNISINKSEGPDEGVVENIIGNNIYSNFGFASNTEIIGTYVDTDKDRIYVFATNFVDSSADNLSNFPVDDVPHPAGGTIPGAYCYIAYIQGPLNNTTTPLFNTIVYGAYLNFSKTHPMLGVDLIEDLLFFTDNRNQPRKINVETAIAQPYVDSSNPGYYFNEDHISVAKFAPFSPISFLDASNNNTMTNDITEFLPAHSTSIVDATTATTVNLAWSNIDITVTPPTGYTRFKNLNNLDLGYFKLISIATNTDLEFEYPIDSGNTPAQSVIAANAAAVEYNGTGSVAFNPDDALQFEQGNPSYDANFEGDENYLKDKFVRFSYRFKYDDGEYSLMAPFTQALFIPKQFGYFLDSGYDGTTKRDEKNTAESGIVKFMENQVTSVDMKIDLPPRYDIDVASPTAGPVQTEFFNNFKVTEVQILAKESDGLAVKVVDEITVEDHFTSAVDRTYTYNYVSNKPFKTLSEAATTRVHDKVPIRAAAQATTGNRIVYGNFIEKHGSPDNLNYYLAVSEKDVINSASYPSFSRKEYINHTVKQNRSYKVGVVLVDRYGRSSNVILRDDSISIGIAGEKSSVYAPYINTNSPLNWPGNNLKISFADLIPPNKNGGYPGVFNGIASANTNPNPLGYLSYKAVVQQLEQDYYNVYVPGVCAGVITFSGELGSSTVVGKQPNYLRVNDTTNIALYGDNINKVPKELADVGPTETIYGSETILYPRVVTKYIVDSTNYPTQYLASLALTQSSQVNKKHEFTVNSIISFSDLGAWTTQRGKEGPNSSYPHDGGVSPDTVYIDPLYLGSTTNPFVAQLETSFLVGYAPTVQKPKTGNPDFSKNLNVFETNPVESKIEIYWETTTSDLIKPLNTAISTSVVGGIGVDIGTPTATPDPVSFTADEGLTPSPTSWVCDAFQAVDANNVLIGAGTIELISIENGDGVKMSPTPFELVNTGGFQYRLRSTSYFMWGSNNVDRTFNINLRILANGNNVVTKQLLLTNKAPSLSPIPSSGSFNWFVGENGDPVPGNPGGSANPFLIYITTAGGRMIGESLGVIDIPTDAFNGSISAALSHDEVVITNADPSQVLQLNQSGRRVDLTTVNDPIHMQSKLGNHLLKIKVSDANDISGSEVTYYSTWVKILQ